MKEQDMGKRWAERQAERAAERAEWHRAEAAKIRARVAGPEWSEQDRQTGECKAQVEEMQAAEWERFA